MPLAEIATKSVVYEMPCMDEVIVRQDLPYKVVDAETLTMDLYLPPPKPQSGGPVPVPVVVFVMGYADAGTRRMLGCSGKEMASYVSWAKLVAASGMAAITYVASRPEVDLHDLLRHLRAHAGELGIDAGRLGLWACSGNVPVALSQLIAEQMSEEGRGVACAVFGYGYLLDLDGASHIADAATTFRFVNASAGRSVAELPPDLPLLIIRAGRDEMPQLNDALDAFVSHALRANLPITVINHHTAPHAFDILDETSASRLIIVRMLAFLQIHLRPAMMPVGQKAVRLDAR